MSNFRHLTRTYMRHDPLPPSQSVCLNGDLMKASSAAITLNLKPTSEKAHISVIFQRIITKFAPNLANI